MRAPSRTAPPAATPKRPSPMTRGRTLEALGVTVAGLSSAEAALKLRSAGANVLKAQTGSHPLAIMLSQFRSPLVLILLAAAALSYALGEADEAIIISLIVLGSSGLGFYQEFRASSTVAALQQRLAIRVNALRDGTPAMVPASEIVPGDIILLAGGSLVPADALLLEANDLHVDEAALTGESFPAIRVAAAIDSPTTPDNDIHMGTSIRSGTATAVVVRTGAATEYAAIAGSVGRLPPETSFAKGIRSFSLLMTQVMLVIVTLVFTVNIILGRPILDSLLFAAALAVGLTPELLPAIVTVTLARGAQKLAQSGVLVKRLVAIENLGAMDVLCTDKTGTLTEGDVQLDRAAGCDGEVSAGTLKLAYLNSSLQSGLPNPLDTAIAASGKTIDIDGYTKLSEVPYDFERKRLSVLVAGPDGDTLITKGAVAAVVSACSALLDGGRSTRLTPARLKTEEARLAAWSNEGLRVLAVASKSMTSTAACVAGDEAGLTLVGYLLFSDPPKPGIAETIASLGDRGVQLKIITGDNRYVAAHIAEKVGLDGTRIMTGAQVEKLGPHALALRVKQINLFAEVTPGQKERIIVALRYGHRVVGYMGDGINDAPALRAADLGISVDNAVDAAKEAADIVLLERDLNVLLNGIVIGRSAFGNTLKYIAITTSANLGNMASMAAASLVLPFLPLLAKQILLNNFLSDLPLLTVSTDRVDSEILEVPGRWDFPRLLRSMIGFGLLSSLFDGLTFAVLLLVFHVDIATFQTGWFVESLLTELVIVGVMRTKRPFYTSRPSPLLVWTSVAAGAVAIAMPYLPLGEATGFRPLSPLLLISLLAIVATYVVASELLKGQIEKLAGVRWLPWQKHAT